MDKETLFTKPTTQAASSDALTSNNKPWAASQDAPKRRRRLKKHKRLVASKDAMWQATAWNAPNQAASQATPTSSASKDAPSITNLNARPRSDLDHGDSRKTANDDAPTRAAATAAVSERDLMSLAEVPPAGTLNMSSLRDTIQASLKRTLTTVSCSTTPSKRRLTALAKAEQHVVMADTAGQLQGPTHCPAEATIETPTGVAATDINRKRSMKPRGRKKTQITNGEPRARTQKRSHLGDPVTPTGVSKQRKPARPHMVDGTLVSNAEAAASFRNNELCVAIMTEPFEDMTQEQAEGIRRNIEIQLCALLMADPEPSNSTQNNAIHFRGKAHYAEGVLKTWCEDAFTFTWLKGIIDGMASPILGTKLTVRPQSEIPKKALCMLFVPENTQDTPALLKLLTRQNPNLNINTWTLTHERIRQEPPGTSLFFRVPVSIVKIIKNQQRRVYYLMGTIYIRFLEEGVTNEDVAVPPTSTASVAPGPELEPPLPHCQNQQPRCTEDSRTKNVKKYNEMRKIEAFLQKAEKNAIMVPNDQCRPHKVFINKRKFYTESVWRSRRGGLN